MILQELRESELSSAAASANKIAIVESRFHSFIRRCRREMELYGDISMERAREIAKEEVGKIQ